MIKRIGIRREDKNQWERRVALVPEQLQSLIAAGTAVKAQPAPNRCYSDEEMAAAGVVIAEDLSDCELLIGVKEMPVNFIQPGKPHLFFSHTIKGQDYNMAMLQDIIAKKAILLDYERIVDADNRRLIAFGRFAGLAGIIDTLALLGQRWQAQGIANPFATMRLSYQYPYLEQAKAEVRQVGEHLRQHGLPSGVDSLRIGIPGYGNVSEGIQEIIRLLDIPLILPQQLINAPDQYKIGYIVFKEEDLVRPRQDNVTFELQHYYDHPQEYHSCFDIYLPWLTVIANAIYWEKRYPRLVTIAALKRLFSQTMSPSLQIIGDISCDIDGSIECTRKITDPGNPAFVFDPLRETISDGCIGTGVAVMAIDMLPAEFAVDASNFFSTRLAALLPDFLNADYEQPLEKSGLPTNLQHAAIVWQGELTPEYRYLESFLGN